MKFVFIRLGCSTRFLVRRVAVISLLFGLSYWVLLMTRLYTIRDVRYNFTGEPLDNPADQSKKVLVLAYFRSGSTFTSHAIAHLNGSFFIFEPLHVMENYLLKTGVRLAYLNGSTRPALLDGYEATYKIRLLVSLFKCEFEDIDTATLFLGFLPMFTPQIGAFINCSKNNSTEKRAVCLFNLKQSCLSASVLVIKTIRLAMYTVEAIVNQVPDLKVIHLIRDPRGQLRSTLLRSPSEDPTLLKEKICNRVSYDIRTRKLLEQQHPTTIKEVIYEDMAQHPVESATRIYDFLRLTLPDYIVLWLQQSTSSSYESLDYLSTAKTNSTLTAYAWVHSVTWSDIYFFQRKCNWLLKHGHFPIFKSERDINTFRAPSRKMVL